MGCYTCRVICFPASGIYHVDKRDHGSENWKIFPVNLKQHLYKLLWHQHNTLKPQQLKRFISWALLQPHSLCFWHSQFAGCWWSNLPHSASIIRMSMQEERKSLSDRQQTGWKGRVCCLRGKATLCLGGAPQGHGQLLCLEGCPTFTFSCGIR